MSKRMLFSTLLGAVLSVAACGGNESSPLEPTAQTVLAQSSGYNANGAYGDWGKIKPSSCKPLIAQTVSGDIGFLGGILQIGPHRLTVLPGALSQKIRITATISADSTNSIRFSPEGLHFVVPAVLEMSYTNCKKIDLTTMKVVYTSDDLRLLLELTASLDKPLNKSVAALISHFSRYAIAY